MLRKERGVNTSAEKKTTTTWRQVRRALTAAVALAVAACGGGSDSPPVSASANIGAAGGEVVIGGGRFRLTVPPGALATAATITVTELKASEVPADLRSVDADLVYRLEPTGLAFAVPATVTAILPPSPNGEIALLGLDSNGVRETPAGMRLSYSATQLLIAGEISHFSTLVVKKIGALSVTLDAASRTVDVGQPFEAELIVKKLASPEEVFIASAVLDMSLLQVLGGVSETDFDERTFQNRNEVKSGAKTMSGTCASAGTGTVSYLVTLANFEWQFFLGGGLINVGEDSLEVPISLDFRCVGDDVPPIGQIATGVFPAPLGLTALDEVRAVPKPFGDTASPNPAVVVAGAQGAVQVDLVTRLSEANLTTAGPDGAVVGTELIGVAYATQAGASAPAARFGFSNTQIAQQNFNPPNGFGGTFLRFGQVLDVITAGGSAVSNTVAMIFPATGINFVAFDAPTQNYAATSEFIGVDRFSGSLVSGALFSDTGPLFAATRNADGGATSKLQVNLRQGGASTTLATFADPQARRMRCVASGGLQRCAISLFGGSLGLFSIDPAAPTATPAVQTVTTAAGTLGVDIAKRANGNLVFVATNFGAGSVSVVETSADLATIVSNTAVPAPAGCTAPAHPAIVADAAGPAVVVTCNTSASLWVFRP